MEVNLLDALLVLFLLSVLVRGWRQGGVSQVASLGGAGLGLVAGAAVAPAVARLIVREPGVELALLTLGVLLIVVVFGQGLGLAVGWRLRRAAHRAGVGAFDRGIGVVVGAAWFVLVVWLLSSLLGQTPIAGLAQQIRGSAIVRVIDQRLPPAPDVFGRVASYLDDQGFPQVFAGLDRGIVAEPVPPTSGAAAQAAAEAGQPSTVQIVATGCGAMVSSGSGFVTAEGFVVTNAHVIAGNDTLIVRDAAGEHDAQAIHFDPRLDLAVLAAPGVQAGPIAWTDVPAERGVEGATLGFPGGQPTLVSRPATVRARIQAVGRDIYGQGTVNREVLDLSAPVQRGDSGGPYVTSDGQVAGVVFAASVAPRGAGYALTADQARPDVEDAISRNEPTDTGRCRF